MIKGINRAIIEVTDTGNVYYERALLVLRPEYTDVQRGLLEKEAKKMLISMQAPSAIKKRHAVFFWVLRLGASAIAGSLITLAFFMLQGM
jgi:hypothetical protein